MPVLLPCHPAFTHTPYAVINFVNESLQQLFIEVRVESGLAGDEA
jgi:hypothetical protein